MVLAGARLVLPALALGLILASGACTPGATPPPGDPSPGAMAEPLPEEASEEKAPRSEAETRAEFREAVRTAIRDGLDERPLGEMMLALGERYLGRPYIVGPLDGFGREVLIARLDSFDCFTYVEALLAMARGLAAGDTTFAGYLDRTEEQRYRDGSMGDYCSRLHYFTEWIVRNAERGPLRDVTAASGGIPLPKRYAFMTAHRESYPALVDDSTFRCVERAEERLNQTVALHFIPQDRIAASYPRLEPGDIVAMATDIEGLDVTHTGLVYRGADGSTGLLHASTDGGVKVSPDLQTYVQGISSQIGIIVARVTDPRFRELPTQTDPEETR